MIDRLKYAITDYFDSWKGRWTLAIGCLLLGFAVPSQRWLLENLVPPIALRWIGWATPPDDVGTSAEGSQTLSHQPPSATALIPTAPPPPSSFLPPPSIAPIPPSWNEAPRLEQRLVFAPSNTAPPLAPSIEAATYRTRLRSDELQLEPISSQDSAQISPPTSGVTASIGEPIQALPDPVQQKRIVMNFQDSPWNLVLQRLASEAGYDLKMDVLPEGTFNYSSNRSMTVSEAIDLFNGYLYSSGYLLVRNGHLLYVVQLDPQEQLPSHLFPMVTPDQLASYGNNELLNLDVALSTIDPTVAAGEIQNLLSPLGKVTALPNSHRIVVTDFGGNLKRLYEMLWIRENDPAYQPQLVFHLKNASAVEVAKAINEYLTGQKQPGGTGGSGSPRANLAASGVSPGTIGVAGTSEAASVVVAEPNSNCILVGSSSHHLEKIRSIIAELDALPPQVLIQALLVEVDLGNVNEFGVELGVQDSVLFDRSVVDKIMTVTETVSNPATGIATTNQSIISQTADPGFNFNNKPLGNNIAANPSRVGSQGLSNFALGRVNTDEGYGGLVLSAGSESISVLLRALAAKRKIDILSRPQIRTLDNKEAMIQIGQQVPVVDGVSLTPVGSANPVIRQDQAGIILTVVPRVSPTNEITIDVQAEKSEFQTGPGSGIPIFTDATNGNVIEAPIKNVSKVDTMVSCISGQTIVLGGMITKGQSKLERKVPVLGDLPFIGWLFRYDNQQVQRKELLIFLTPHVVRHPATSDAHTVNESNRIHFPHADAAQIHGQCPTPPNPDEPRGIEFPERHYERWWERKQRRREAHQAKPPMFQTPAAPEPMGHEGWMMPYDALPPAQSPHGPPVVPIIELGSR